MGRRKIWIQFLKISFAIAVIFVGWWFSFRLGENEQIAEFVRSYGYAGIFIIAIVSGFNLIVPVPAISLLPIYVASGLELSLVFLTISVGVTIADTAAYYIGHISRAVASNEVVKTIQKLEKWRERNPALPFVILFFFASFVPLPNEVLVIPMGFLGYRLAYVLPIVFAGNMLFNIFSGYGLINILGRIM